MVRRETRSHGAGTVREREYAADDARTTVDVEALADIQAYSDLKERRKKAKRKKAITLSVVGAVLLLAVVGGIIWLLNSMTAAPKNSETVQNAYVERGNFLDTVSASGVLAPISSVSATPEIDGLVGEVFISEGDTVTAGQKLYTIINADLDKLVTQAKQGINEANNGIAQAQIALDDAYRAKRQGIAAEAEARAAAAEAKAAAEAAAAVGEGGGKDALSREAVTPFDVGQADSAIKQAELALASARNNLTNAQTAYDDAVAKAEKRTVTSSISGSVVAVNIEPGKSLGAVAGAAPVAPVQIADLSRMVVSVEVNEIDILKVQAEQTARMTFSAVPNLEIGGKVTHIATVSSGGADTANMGMGMGGMVTYSVKILIENPDPRLKPGMTAKATIEFKSLDDVLLLPMSAVTMLSDTEGLVSLVDPKDPQKSTEKKVKILASDGLMVVVEGDLKEGDEVLSVGGDGQDLEGDMMSSGSGGFASGTVIVG